MKGFIVLLIIQLTMWWRVLIAAMDQYQIFVGQRLVMVQLLMVHFVVKMYLIAPSSNHAQVETVTALQVTSVSSIPAVV